MADMAVSLLTRVLDDLDRHPLEDADDAEAAAELPPPMYRVRWRRSRGLWPASAAGQQACSTGGPTGQGTSTHDPISGDLQACLLLQARAPASVQLAVAPLPLHPPTSPHAPKPCVPQPDGTTHSHIHIPLRSPPSPPPTCRATTPP
jgi:hypothetical protein